MFFCKEQEKIAFFHQSLEVGFFFARSRRKSRSSLSPWR